MNLLRALGIDMYKKQMLGAWTLTILYALPWSLNAQTVSSETQSQQDESVTSAIADSQVTDSAQELPTDPKQAGRPSLDYVPSEAISEDRSVSFPVDI